VKWLIAFCLFLSSPIWPLGENPLPGDPFIIVNKRTNELAYIDEGAIQWITKVATGKEKEMTPEGLFTVIVKAKNPYYRKKNIPGGHPDNPLGTRWIGFDAHGTDGRIYGIHGTKDPTSIGKYVSQGCIRLLNEHVEYLYDKIPLGTKILIVNSDKTISELGIQYGALPSIP
jgi:lipoprotein-anchoring transpeptidase ErfK/SrfK